MEHLALTLPGFPNVAGPENLKPEFTDIGSLITNFLPIVFYIAAFLAFFWLVWGAFQYILARGNKEDLAKARSRITWAIVGLLITLLAYSIARFGAEIFPPGRGGLPF